MEQIKTKQDDARAVLRSNPALAQKLISKDSVKRVTKSTGPELVIKSQMRMCPQCGANVPGDEVDCPECGKMIGKVDNNVLPEELQETQNYSGEDVDELEPNSDVISSQGENVDELTDNTETDVDEGHESAPDEELKHKTKEKHTHPDVEQTDEVEASKDETDSEGMSISTPSDVSYRKSSVQDELILEASQALESVQKALTAPGTDKGEILAHAANLVGAIRDYAHSLAAVPDGGITTEGQMATNDMNPAPQPMQKVGGNPAPIPEQAVNQHPQVDQAQEEAMEDSEVAADENQQDEAEEGRLMFSKQPTNQAKQQAMAPPVPVKPKKKSVTPVDSDVKVRTQANADVKSATKSPAEAFLHRWTDTLLPILDSSQGYSRLEKRELMQKSLNEFAPSVIEFINQTTDVGQVDLAAAVQAAVAHAVEQLDAQHKSQLGGLEAKIETLTKVLTEGAVEKAITQRSGLQRKSLGMLRPDTQPIQPPQTELQIPVLNGDQTPIRKFRASEIAQATVSAPRY